MNFTQPRSLLVAIALVSVGMVGPFDPAVAQLGGSNQRSRGLEIETIAERRLSADGIGRFVAAQQLHVGDEIYYTLRVRNVTDAPLDDVVVVRAIPRNTRYVEGSAIGPAATVAVSIDGGATFAEPGTIELQVSPGTVRMAVSDDYTHLRWQLRYPLAAGATALLRFRGVFR